jgi:hypothetical protein
LLQECAESKKIQHLGVSESCRKECEQEVFLRRRRVVEKFRKDKAFETVEGLHRSCTLKACKEASKVCVQVDEFRGGTLGHFADFAKEGWTVGILRGEFAIFRGPSDLMEEKGRYCRYFERFKAQEGQDHRSESQGPSDPFVDSHIGVSWVETP